MTSQNQKIGELIAQVRKERGLTQQEFAKSLKTSQSAVNRIEKGKQNVSIQMLARISEVLNKQLVEIGTGKTNFQVEGGRELSGEISVKVSKNAAVGLLAASLLNKGVSVFKKFPKIEEVHRLIEVLESIGVTVRWHKNGDLEVNRPAKLKLDEMDAAAARKTRSVIMFLGPLMHEFGSFALPYAGGCKLGERTVRPHLFALEEFGVKIHASRGQYDTTVRRKHPDEVILYEAGDTVTENAIFAAAKMKEKTTIKYASANYSVQDVALYLQKLGVQVEGIGGTTMTIKGVPEINKKVEYAPSEDPIEAMLFLSIAATTNSSITIKRCPIEFIELELLKLEKMGFRYEILKRYKAENGFTKLVDIKTLKTDELVALDDKIHALPYPGINMDNLPFFVPVAARARGKTLIHDWSYETRAIYYTDLNRLNANITLADPHRVYIEGPTRWRPAEIVSPPALRPAVIILIAMLAAKGTSVLRDVYSINRGYEDLDERLNSLGANIKVLTDI